jgi:hypothetical protein
MIVTGHYHLYFIHPVALYDLCGNVTQRQLGLYVVIVHSEFVVYSYNGQVFKEFFLYQFLYTANGG